MSETYYPTAEERLLTADCNLYRLMPLEGLIKGCGLAEGAYAYDPEMNQDRAGAADILGQMLRPIMKSVEAMQLAQALLARFGSISAVLAASEQILCSVPGMNPAAVQMILQTHELFGFTLREEIAEREIIGRWTDLERYLKLRLRCRPNECFMVLYLDKRNGLIKDEILWEGTVDHAPLYVRTVVHKALHYNASAIIVAHNHPSGDPTPSPQDIIGTRQIASALAAIDIALHDHAIVGHNRIISLRHQGIL